MIGTIKKVIYRLTRWRKKDPLIISMRMVNKHDNSAVEMVSEQWIKRQEKINEAAAEVYRLGREFAAAQERLGDVMRKMDEC